MNLLTGTLGIDTWLIVKTMFMIGMGLYLVFGLVIIRQVGHMTKTLRVGFETPLRIFALIHFLASVCLFVIALLYL